MLQRKEIAAQIIEKAFDIIKRSSVKLPHSFELEISFPCEMERFADFGAVLIILLKKEFCKKYIIFLKGQRLPEHLHPLRIENLRLIMGEVVISIDGDPVQMVLGEYYEIKKNQWHEFKANEDSVIEEISTEYQQDGSRYKDESINQKQYNDRKIKVLFQEETYHIV